MNRTWHWLREKLRRRRRLLRLHLVADEGSLEGIFLGYEAGHYRLANARMIFEVGRSIPLDGEAWVRRERVLYAQALG